jgi:hypothetical protein
VINAVSNPASWASFNFLYSRLAVFADEYFNDRYLLVGYINDSFFIFAGSVSNHFFTKSIALDGSVSNCIVYK